MSPRPAAIAAAVPPTTGSDTLLSSVSTVIAAPVVPRTDEKPAKFAPTTMPIRWPAGKVKSFGSVGHRSSTCSPGRRAPTGR